MAKCQMCGAEVKIGQYCAYCGSMAEPYNYPMHLRIKEKIIPAKKISDKNDRGHSHEQVYVVEREDGLWTIANRFYGKGSGSERIVRENPEMTNPNIIYPGQKIKIPK